MGGSTFQSTAATFLLGWTGPLWDRGLCRSSVIDSIKKRAVVTSSVCAYVSAVPVSLIASETGGYLVSGVTSNFLPMWLCPSGFHFINRGEQVSKDLLRGVNYSLEWFLVLRRGV